jgi:hypothetical protein
VDVGVEFEGGFSSDFSGQGNVIVIDDEDAHNHQKTQTIGTQTTWSMDHFYVDVALSSQRDINIKIDDDLWSDDFFLHNKSYKIKRTFFFSFPTNNKRIWLFCSTEKFVDSC